MTLNPPAHGAGTAVLLNGDPYPRLSEEAAVARIPEVRRRLGTDVLILGHHYQRDEVIRFADLTGDSYGLSRQASQRHDSRYIVFCGVHFMAETADILAAPEQRVILPDLSAGCSMADMAELDQVELAWEEMGEALGHGGPGGHPSAIRHGARSHADGAGARPAAERPGTRRAGSGRDGAGRDGSGRDGSGRDGSGRDGSGRDGSGRDGAGRDGSGRDGAGRDGASRDGSERDGSGRDGSGRDGSAHAAETAPADALAADPLCSEVMPITYVNSTAAIKAFVGERGGAVCTSSNAGAVFDWALARRPRLFFFPDQHLGRNTAFAKGIPLGETLVWDPALPLGGNTPEEVRRARIYLWKGHCQVHTRFRLEQVQAYRRSYPGIKILVHPECPLEVVQAADHVGSTSFIIRTVEAAPAGSQWAIGTEIHLVNRLKNQHPDKLITSLLPGVCLCSTMNRIDPQHLLYVLEKLAAGEVVNEIVVPEPAHAKARMALDRMLSIS